MFQRYYKDNFKHYQPHITTFFYLRWSDTDENAFLKDFLPSTEGSDYVFDDPNDIFLFVRSVTLPTFTLNTQTIPLPFFNFKVQTRINFGETISVTFTEPDLMLVRKFFNKWKKFITNYIDGTISLVHKYKQEMWIDLGVPLKKDDFVQLYRYKLVGVFPTNINELPMQYETTEVVTTEITFAYDYMEEMIRQSGSEFKPIHEFIQS